MAKRKVGMYRDDRPDWLKIKNRSYSQAEGRHELLMRKAGRHGLMVRASVRAVLLRFYCRSNALTGKALREISSYTRPKVWHELSMRVG